MQMDSGRSDDPTRDLKPYIGYWAALAVRFRGKLDIDALQVAYQLLTIRHPVLRGRIRSDGNGYVLYIDPLHQPRIKILVNGGEEELRREANSAWDARESLSRPILAIERRDGGLFALQVDIAVMDGTALGEILADLWSYYSQLVNDGSLSVRYETRLPAAPSALSLTRWRGTDNSSAPVPATIPNRAEVRDVLRRRIRFSVEETHEIVSAARSRNTSVNGLVCGAILLSQRRLSTIEGPVRMICRSVVDLRGRATPPVGATETTRFLSIHRAVVDVSNESNIYDIGEELKAQLNSALLSRNLSLFSDFSSVPTGESQDSSAPVHIVNASVSNVHPIKKFETPEGLRIVDLVPIHTESGPMMFPAYSVITYAQRLSIMCYFPSGLYTEVKLSDAVNAIEKELKGLLQDSNCC